MTNKSNCPEKPNDELIAAFVDTAEEQHLTDLSRKMELAAQWMKTLPASQGHNASRLHEHNLTERREACDLIDEHRATPEGKAAYNAKRREKYVPVGEQKRDYVTGLSEEEKAERRRLQKRASDKKRSAKTATAVKSAKRAKSRDNKAKREAAEAKADIEARRIF